MSNNIKRPTSVYIRSMPYKYRESILGVHVANVSRRITTAIHRMVESQYQLWITPSPIKPTAITFTHGHLRQTNIDRT